MVVYSSNGFVTPTPKNSPAQYRHPWELVEKLVLSWKRKGNRTVSAAAHSPGQHFLEGLERQRISPPLGPDVLSSGSAAGRGGKGRPRSLGKQRACIPTPSPRETVAKAFLVTSRACKTPPGPSKYCAQCSPEDPDQAPRKAACGQERGCSPSPAWPGVGRGGGTDRLSSGWSFWIFGGSRNAEPLSPEVPCGALPIQRLCLHPQPAFPGHPTRPHTPRAPGAWRRGRGACPSPAQRLHAGQGQRRVQLRVL